MVSAWLLCVVLHVGLTSLLVCGSPCMSIYASHPICLSVGFSVLCLPNSRMKSSTKLRMDRKVDLASYNL